MKLVSYQYNITDRVAILHEQNIYPLYHFSLPATMGELLNSETAFDEAKKINSEIKSGKHSAFALRLDSVELLSPVPFPNSTRDGYAFRQHVMTARRNRGVEMIEEFDQFPVFYFTNHTATFGPGNIELMPDHFRKFDFELEIAVVIGKRGRNIKAADADNYIAGYMIMNDLSARELQMDEMKLNLGPAKGKDMGNCFGPFMITPDELTPFLAKTKENHVGNQYNMAMRAYHNGELISEGNVNQMDWTFAEIIERAAYGADIFPGDVIGSGTVGTGCYLELNGSHKLANPDYTPVWIQPGDEVRLEIDQLGVLTNTFSKADTNFSLLDIKK